MHISTFYVCGKVSGKNYLRGMCKMDKKCLVNNDIGESKLIFYMGHTQNYLENLCANIKYLHVIVKFISEFSKILKYVFTQ
jgi:hypothetical protein